MRASSAPFATFSESLPLSELAFSMIPSTVPNRESRSMAVFSPTPRIPGMLSDASPASARKSIICAGEERLQCSRTPCSSYISAPSPAWDGRYRRTPGRTSCAASLSGVAMYTSNPAAAPLTARVPITSSASKPSTRTTGMRRASASSIAYGMDAARSSGIFCRCALYGGYASWRNVGPPGSMAKTMCVGCSFLRMESSPLASPSSAEVLIPVEVILGERRNTKWPLYRKGIISTMKSFDMVQLYQIHGLYACLRFLGAEATG